tara:strand:+ start:625 stop:792 length:168 start_codon:yes stop_codon:yes gene_type:complete
MLIENFGFWQGKTAGCLRTLPQGNAVVTTMQPGTGHAPPQQGYHRINTMGPIGTM